MEIITGEGELFKKAPAKQPTAGGEWNLAILTVIFKPPVSRQI
jgi:hypothetical protein